MRQRWITVVALALVVASILYSPHHMHYNPEAAHDQYYAEAMDRVEYVFLWNAPDHSLLDLGRLTITWLGIAVVGGLALYVNETSK
jgi:hypothetical protein